MRIVLFLPLLAVAQDFRTTLYPVLENAGCRKCHFVDGVASPTRLHFPDSPEKVDAFGRSLVELVDRTNPDNSILLRKPTGRMPHAGGARIKPGTPEETALRAWIEKLVTLDPAEAANYRKREAAGGGYAKTRIFLRRLTHHEYNNIARDLLGDTSQPAQQFPPEDFVNGFKTQYQGQTISPLLMEAYSQAAEKLARNAVAEARCRHLPTLSRPSDARPFDVLCKSPNSNVTKPCTQKAVLNSWPRPCYSRRRSSSVSKTPMMPR